MFEATWPELYGWIAAILMLFLPAVILIVIFDTFNPEMENKRTWSFFIGWMPSNLVACFYLGYTTCFINFFTILIVCEIVQLITVFSLRDAFLKMGIK